MITKSKKSKKLGLPLEHPSSDVKVRVTTMIDEDIVFWLKSEADKVGGKYQTLLNFHLRACMGSQKTTSLESRIDRIEQAVFKKAN